MFGFSKEPHDLSEEQYARSEQKYACSEKQYGFSKEPHACSEERYGFSRKALIAADGKYSIIGILPGTYTIKADDLQRNIQTKVIHIRRSHIETINFDF